MRIVLLALLLAGASSPAIAAEQGRWSRSDRGDRSERSQSRSESRSDRDSDSKPQRVDRSAEPKRADTSAPRDVKLSEPRRIEPRTMDDLNARKGSFEARTLKNGERRERGSRPSLQQTEIPSADVSRVERRAGDSVRELRDRDSATQDRSSSIEQRNLRRAPTGNGNFVEQQRRLPNVLEKRERRVSRTPVFGTEPPAPRTATALHARPSRNWSTSWRHDRRYDWRDYRRHNRSRFHFAFYNDPFGWNYYRYGIGWRLWPSYYRSSYWLNDPWYYRLPPAYGPYRWIRYHQDALLVNIYTGEVVDVEYNFFW